MHTLSFRSLAASISLAAVLLPSAAAGAAPATFAEFYGRHIYMEGTWKTDVQLEQVTFTNGNTDVLVRKIKADECAFNAIRTNALHAWGGTRLQQKDFRLLNITFGRTSRSTYRGYKWIMPDAKGKAEQHWCLGQEPKVAVEIVTPLSDTRTVRFIDRSLVLQLATRRGR